MLDLRRYSNLFAVCCKHFIVDLSPSLTQFDYAIISSPTCSIFLYGVCFAE